MPGPAIEPDQRRLAERRVLAALRRFHRSEPLASGMRLDTLLTRARQEGERDRRPAGHRGAGELLLDDRALRVVVEDLAASGRVSLDGRRVALPGAARGLEAGMAARVDRLLEGLRSAGASPPRVEAVAARLGIPPAVIDRLRAAGTLVAVAPGIDYPRDVHRRLGERLDALAQRQALTIRSVAVELRTTRRFAEALLSARRAARDARRAAQRDRRRAGQAAPTRASPASAGGHSSDATSRASRKAAAAAPRSPRAS